MTGNKRVVSGCLTCRVRRVKCDEGKPSCRNCIRAKRLCEGYPQARVPRKALQEQSDGDAGTLAVGTVFSSSLRTTPENSLLVLPYASDEEKLSFELFLHAVATQPQQLAVPDFWRLALQLSPAEPSIRSLALAMGTFNRRAQAESMSGWDVEQIQSQMLLHYGQALQQTRHLISRSKHKQDVSTALVACVLFVWYEMITGNFPAAHAHLHCGLEIIDSVSPGFDPVKSYYEGSFESNLQIMADALARADLQLRSFADSTTYYPFDKRLIIYQDWDIYLADGFNSIQDAVRTMTRSWQQVLHVCTKTFVLFASPQRPKELPEELWTLNSQVLIALGQWKQAFDKTIASSSPRSDSSNEFPSYEYGLLYCYYECAKSLMTSGMSGREADWDQDIPAFKRCLEIMAAIENDRAPFADGKGMNAAFELGCTPLLFMIANKCRDPKLRRIGIELLEKSDRFEGLVSSRVTAIACRAVMSYEEANAMPVPEGRDLQASDIPEDSRVFAVDAKTNILAQRLCVYLVVGVNSSDGPRIHTSGHFGFSTMKPFIPGHVYTVGSVKNGLSLVGTAVKGLKNVPGFNDVPGAPDAMANLVVSPREM